MTLKLRIEDVLATNNVRTGKEYEQHHLFPDENGNHRRLQGWVDHKELGCRGLCSADRRTDQSGHDRLTKKRL
jgi:hypothetical protein